MVLCTRFYTFVSYAKLNMKWKYIKSKAYDSSPSGKLIVSYLGGTRFKTLFVPLCMQKNISRPIFYIYKCFCNGHLSSHYMCAYCTFSIFPIPHNFHAVAENLHNNVSVCVRSTSVASFSSSRSVISWSKAPVVPPCSPRTRVTTRQRFHVHFFFL